MLKPNRLAHVQQPALEPLTLAETKLYLRVDGSAEDALITDMVVTARSYAEHYLRRSLITQQWKAIYLNTDSNILTLPMGPTQSVSSVVLLDDDGSSTSLTADGYTYHTGDSFITLRQLPSTNRAEITYSAGYGLAEQVPQPLKYGMLAHIAAMYDDKSNAASLPASTESLYQPYRCLEI